MSLLQFLIQLLLGCLIATFSAVLDWFNHRNRH